MNKENPKSCEKCGQVVPVNTYNPNTPGYPAKRVTMCNPCAAKELNAVLITPDNPHGLPMKVPEIAPAVPEPPAEPQTIEHGPKLQELNVAPPETPGPAENKGQIVRDEIKVKLAAQEKDVDALVGQRTKLQGQLAQVSELIIAKRGAIAQMRDILGQ